MVLREVETLRSSSFWFLWLDVVLWLDKAAIEMFTRLAQSVEAWLSFLADQGLLLLCLGSLGVLALYSQITTSQSAWSKQCGKGPSLVEFNVSVCSRKSAWSTVGPRELIVRCGRTVVEHGMFICEVFYEVGQPRNQSRGIIPRNKPRGVQLPCCCHVSVRQDTGCFPALC